MKTLSDIPPNQPMEITAISSDSRHAGRLASLGFLPGRRVRVCRVAPLGDPISIEMEGQIISVRRTEAELVEVKELK